MTKWKKLFCAVLCFVVIAGALGGCTKRETESSGLVSSSVSPEPVSEAPDGPYRIGLVQYMEHPSLDAAREAFMGRLEEWGYDESKVQIDYRSAGGDAVGVEDICQDFVKKKTDMIVAISTPAAQAAVKAAQGTDVQVLFAAVSDPEKNLSLKNTEAPEGNVTGTAVRVPISSLVDLAMQADPNLKTLGLLYSSGESYSVDAAAQAKQYGEEKGLQVVESPVSGAEEISQAAADLCAKADAVITGGDNGIAASAAAVAEAARKAKTPWYAAVDSMVQSGALASLGVDYTELGCKTADMAVRLMEGVPAAQTPVCFFEDSRTCVNQDTLDALGVSLPEDVLNTAYFFIGTAGAGTDAADSSPVPSASPAGTE